MTSRNPDPYKAAMEAASGRMTATVTIISAGVTAFAVGVIVLSRLL